jgi:hypothetical protein
VLGLLAEGRTNRQIGEALFISEKTASVHVTNLLRKLGVGSRTEAAEMSRRLRLYSQRTPLLRSRFVPRTRSWCGRLPRITSTPRPWLLHAGVTRPC